MPKKIKLSLKELNVESFITESISGGLTPIKFQWGDCFTRFTCATINQGHCTDLA